MKNELVRSRLHNSTPTEHNHFSCTHWGWKKSGKSWWIAAWRIKHFYVFHIVKIFVHYSCLKLIMWIDLSDNSLMKMFTSAKSNLYNKNNKAILLYSNSQCFTSRCCDPLKEWRKLLLDAKKPKWISFEIERPRWTTLESLPGIICV